MSNAKEFRINGSFVQKGFKSTFTKEVTALNEELATERVLSKLGSDHHLQRNRINIEKVEEIK